MPKRLHDTNIWDEDWFYEIATEYQMFFFWIKDHCDHAGIWKANKKKFEDSTGLRVDIVEAMRLYNEDKERFVKVNGNKYLYKDFFVFQYGAILNISNLVHLSIVNIYLSIGVDLGSIRGLIGVRQGVKDIDKEIYNNTNKLIDYIRKNTSKKKERIYKKESGNERDGY